MIQSSATPWRDLDQKQHSLSSIYFHTMPFAVTLPRYRSTFLARLSSYLAAKTASGQANLSDFIDTTDRVLVFRQVFGTGVRGLHGRSALEDGRQTSGTDIELAELIVCHLDRVSWVAVTLREDRSSLRSEVLVSRQCLHDEKTYSAHDLAISRFHVNQPSRKDRGCGMVACLCKDSHSRPQCQLNVSRLQVAMREVGGKFQVSDSVFRLFGCQPLSFRLEPQTNNVFLR